MEPVVAEGTIGGEDGSADEAFFAGVAEAEIHDLHATMLHLMGVDHTRSTFRFSGRDMRLTDVHGNVIACRDLIGAIDYANALGALVVASAGNTGPAPMTIGVPGNVPYVITVGAMSDGYGLLAALRMLPVFTLIAGGLFFVGSFYYARDLASVKDVDIVME